MCGIFALLGEPRHSPEDVKNASLKGRNRGPEHSSLVTLSNKVTLGFNRLAINGLDQESNQPLMIDDSYYLICNGEIYNYRELYKELKVAPESCSDCEIVLHIYKRYGIEGVVQMIDGVFAMVLVDMKKNRVFIARDTFGVRPLFYMETYPLSFASEMKQLIPLSSISDNITQFAPGTYSEFIFSSDSWHLERSVTFATFPFMTRMEFPYPSEYDIYKYMGQISRRMHEAVRKRVTSTERPIACLLSGGLDSSLVTALVAQYFKDRSKLETYSIGLEGSEDIKYAEMVAKHLGTKHTSIIVSEADFLNAIPEVIYAIESYDTTTVRASVGNFLVAKYIKEHSEAKVIFNGDGSDELTGGYLYFHKAPSSRDFDMECKRLLKNIHYFDVLRSDRCISYHGLEARTPFLDRSLVEHYLTIPIYLRDHTRSNEMEKYMLRHCFDINNFLPHEVLFRRKEAFSDGVSSQKKSWYETIQENVPEQYLDLSKFSMCINAPTTPEQCYYRTIFDNYYKERDNVIPYYWMPKYTDAVDCSARSLKIYKSLVQK